jgi:hypothetical protein
MMTSSSHWFIFLICIYLSKLFDEAVIEQIRNENRKPRKIVLQKRLREREEREKREREKREREKREREKREREKRERESV